MLYETETRPSVLSLFSVYIARFLSCSVIFGAKIVIYFLIFVAPPLIFVNPLNFSGDVTILLLINIFHYQKT